MAYRVNPKTDVHGNLWLTRDHIHGSAIFPHKLLKKGDIVRTGKYTAWRGLREGFVTDDFGRRIFYDSMEAALAALR